MRKILCDRCNCEIMSETGIHLVKVFEPVTDVKRRLNNSHKLVSTKELCANCINDLGAFLGNDYQRAPKNPSDWGEDCDIHKLL